MHADIYVKSYKHVTLILIPVRILYVVRSIADLSDLRRRIYWGAKCQYNYAAKVRYRGYGPTNTILYNLWYIIWLVCNRRTFLCEMAKHFWIFHSEVDIPYYHNEPCHNMKLCMIWDNCKVSVCSHLHKFMSSNIAYMVVQISVHTYSPQSRFISVYSVTLFMC